MNFIFIFRVKSFAQVIEKSTVTLPYPPPGSSATSSLLNTLSSTFAGDGGFGVFSSVNTGIYIQHAGFWYLAAARCKEVEWSMVFISKVKKK